MSHLTKLKSTLLTRGGESSNALHPKCDLGISLKRCSPQNNPGSELYQGPSQELLRVPAAHPFRE